MSEPVALNDLTELVDFQADRVDLVGSGANGYPMLVIKSLEDDPDLAAAVQAAQSDEVSKASGNPQLGDGEGPVDTDPGSPEWEAADSANLTQAATTLAHVRQRLELAADRESAEVAAGHTDDFNDVWDLQDAMSALDCATAIVARLSFAESAEADGAPVTKAALSPQNRAALLAVHQTITGLVGDQPREEVTEVTKSEVEQMLDEKLADVTKAIAALAPAKPEEAAETAATDDVAKETGDEPAAEVVTPEADVAKEEKEEPAPAPDSAEVLKSAAAEVFKAAFEPVAEVLKGMGDVVGKLEERLAVVEKQPMPGGPLLGGAPRPADAGRNQGGSDLPAELMEVAKALADATDPQERADLHMKLSQIRLRAAIGG